MKIKNLFSTQLATNSMFKKTILVLIAFVFTQAAFSQSLFDKAREAYANKDYKTSIQLYSQYIADHGSDVSAYFNRGLAYYDLDDYEMALIDFNKVVKLDASYHKGYYQIASCQLAKELYKEAIFNYTMATDETTSGVPRQFLHIMR
jgi:tetratricopeptide (TPR) repeat protein